MPTPKRSPSPPRYCSPPKRRAPAPKSDGRADPETSSAHARAIPDRISSKQDGTLAAANIANRKRTVLNNLMAYAEVERKLLTGNPLKARHVEPPAETQDR
jgi:hypothetical protein